MTTHSSILAWKIPWTEDPGGHSPWIHTELDITEATEHGLMSHPYHLGKVSHLGRDLFASQIPRQHLRATCKQGFLRITASGQCCSFFFFGPASELSLNVTPPREVSCASGRISFLL